MCIFKKIKSAIPGHHFTFCIPEDNIGSVVQSGTHVAIQLSTPGARPMGYDLPTTEDAEALIREIYMELSDTLAEPDSLYAAQDSLAAYASHMGDYMLKNYFKPRNLPVDTVAVTFLSDNTFFVAAYQKGVLALSTKVTKGTDILDEGRRLADTLEAEEAQ